jgi:DNA-binding response OmpR family regulator
MASDKHDGRPGRVLVVDDDPVAAHFVKRVLGTQGGFDVTHTPDPAVALGRASSEDWDLMLTDAEMPGMSGLELLRAVRGLVPDLPIAVISAHPSASTTARALRSEADEFIEKPVRMEQLLATVTSLVARGRAAPLA